MLNQRSRLALGAAVLLLTACEHDLAAPPGAEPVSGLAAAAVPADRDVYQGAWELWGVYWGFECDGQESELVEMSGGIRYRLQLLEDPAGGFHVVGQERSHDVAGVGVESGEAYRVKEIVHETFNDNGMGMLGGFSERVTLTGRDTRRGFVYTATGRYVFNANGELVLERDSETFSCTI